MSFAALKKSSGASRRQQSQERGAVEKSLQGRNKLAQGGTGVPDARRLCARWGGGTGVPDARRLCTRWGGGTGVPSMRLSSARSRAFKKVVHAGVVEALGMPFAGAPHVGLTCGSLHRILASALSARQAPAGTSGPGASHSIVRKYYRHSAAGLKQTVY